VLQRWKPSNPRLQRGPKGGPAGTNPKPRLFTWDQGGRQGRTPCSTWKNHPTPSSRGPGRQAGGVSTWNPSKTLSSTWTSRQRRVPPWKPINPVFTGTRGKAGQAGVPLVSTWNHPTPLSSVDQAGSGLSVCVFLFHLEPPNPRLSLGPGKGAGGCSPWEPPTTVLQFGPGAGQAGVFYVDPLFPWTRQGSAGVGVGVLRGKYQARGEKKPVQVPSRTDGSAPRIGQAGPSAVDSRRGCSK